MPNTNEPSKAPFPKPVELMIADAFYVRLNMRKNHILFKDLSERDARYSFWQYPSALDHRKSILDIHKTIQTYGNPPKQIPIFKKEYEQSLMERIAQELMTTSLASFRIVKVNDSALRDLEVKFIPLQEFAELLQSVRRKQRLCFDTCSLIKLEKLIHQAKLKDIDGHGWVIGNSLEGYTVLTDGVNCIFLDTSNYPKILEKNLKPLLS